MQFACFIYALVLSSTDPDELAAVCGFYWFTVLVFFLTKIVITLIVFAIQLVFVIILAIVLFFTWLIRLCGFCKLSPEQLAERERRQRERDE